MAHTTISKIPLSDIRNMRRDIVRSQLIDYILLNAYSLNSSGLYHGKAGIALALFEYSRLTNDDYICENAFEIIKEAIISKNNNISFEDGLSGIGYVLNHLIKRRFLDGNLWELYEENIEHIIQVLDNTMPNNLYKYITTLLFTSQFIERRLGRINSMIIKCTEDILIKFLCKKDPIAQPLINLFHTYIKVVTIAHIRPSTELIGLFIDAYNNKRTASNLFVGYYLKHISQSKIINDDLQVVANENILKGIDNIHLETLSLAQCINTAYVINECERSFESSGIVNMHLKDNIDRNLSEFITLGLFDPNDCIAGYQSGISRLVLYWVYINDDSNNIYFL